MAKQKKVVIYDGLCGLCDSAVSFLLKVDKKNIFFYTSLQGEYVKTLDINSSIDSIVFYDEGEITTKSTDILKILSSLGGWWGLSKVCYVFPRFFRDFFYDLLAKHRYKIFKRREQCRLPTKEEATYFLN